MQRCKQTLRGHAGEREDDPDVIQYDGGMKGEFLLERRFSWISKEDKGTGGSGGLANFHFR